MISNTIVNTKFLNKLSRALEIHDDTSEPQIELYYILDSIIDDLMDFKSDTDNYKNVSLALWVLKEEVSNLDLDTMDSEENYVVKRTLVNIAELVLEENEEGLKEYLQDIIATSDQDMTKLITAFSILLQVDNINEQDAVLDEIFGMCL